MTMCNTKTKKADHTRYAHTATYKAGEKSGRSKKTKLAVIDTFTYRLSGFIIIRFLSIERRRLRLHYQQYASTCAVQRFKRIERQRALWVLSTYTQSFPLPTVRSVSGASSHDTAYARDGAWTTRKPGKGLGELPYTYCAIPSTSVSHSGCRLLTRIAVLRIAV